jgi:hypothetical protein
MHSTSSPEVPLLPEVGQRRRDVDSPEEILASCGREDFLQEDPQSNSFPHTEGKNLHLNASLSLTQKAQRHIKMLLDMCLNVCSVPLPAVQAAQKPDPPPLA